MVRQFFFFFQAEIFEKPYFVKQVQQLPFT